MKPKSHSAGMSLIELLVAMAIASIAGSIILQVVIGFQSRILTEVRRNDLQDRADRLLRFMANDIANAAFRVGAVPRVADGAPPTLIHDSISGDPAETLSGALLPEDRPGADDRLTLLKAVAFEPPLRLVLAADEGALSCLLNRRPNRSPGSTRELQPAPEAINHLAFANHALCYTVQTAQAALVLSQPLREPVSAGTEVFGIRAITYALDPNAGSHRLRRDDWTRRDILDDAVDGMQFSYLLADGSQVDEPGDPRAIRGVRISLLVRALRPDQTYTDRQIYALGNRNYGPFRDHYRRRVVSQLVEVKNHAL